MKKKTLYLIIEVVLLAAIVVVSIYNAIANCDFWKFSFPQALTLAVAILIAFSAAQFKIDERKQKEQAEKLVIKIQEIVNETSFYSFPNNGDVETLTKQSRMACRKLNNCISILKEYSRKLNVKYEVEYISNQFKDYNDFISEHPSDLDYLNKSESTLKKYSENIDSKCDQIILNLYK